MLVSISRVAHYIPSLFPLSFTPHWDFLHLSEGGWHRKRFRSLEGTEIKEKNWEQLEEKLSENKIFQVKKIVVKLEAIFENTLNNTETQIANI